MDKNGRWYAYACKPIKLEKVNSWLGLGSNKEGVKKIEMSEETIAATQALLKWGESMYSVEELLCQP